MIEEFNELLFLMFEEFDGSYFIESDLEPNHSIKQSSSSSFLLTKGNNTGPN